MKIGSYILMKDKLKGGYLEAFESVELYGQNALISNKVMNEKMMDLVDMLLEAQENNVPAEQIVGSDINAYCKNYFSDFSTADRFLNIAKELVLPVWLLLIFESIRLLSAYGNEGFGFFTLKDDIAPFIIGFLSPSVTSTIANIICRIMTEHGGFSKKAYSAVRIVFGAMSLLLMITLMVCYIVSDVALEISCAAVIIPSAVYLLVYYGTTFAYRKIKFGSIASPDEGYETSFRELVKEELKKQDVSTDKSIVRSYAKRYRKLNKKRTQKGLAKLTTLEFFTREKHNSRNASMIGLLIGYAIVIVWIFVNKKFVSESAFDIVLFFVLLAVMGVFIVKLFNKADKTIENQQVKILAACSRNGVELDEYYDSLDDISVKAE